MKPNRRCLCPLVPQEKFVGVIHALALLSAAIAYLKC
jgi:hypothetical protein